MPSARTGINFKVIGLTQPGFENVRSRFEPTTFGFAELPEREADALTHSATPGQTGNTLTERPEANNSRPSWLGLNH